MEPVLNSLTLKELEAENARLRKALLEATNEAQRVSDWQVARDERHRADLAISRNETAQADQQTREVRADARSAANEHQRQMIGATADLSASQGLMTKLRASQAALASSEARQRAIFESAIDLP